MSAGIPLESVAITAILGVNAIAGNSASPSFEIAFPINAAKGIIPFKYNVVTSTCGPQPGIKPTKTAKIGRNIQAASATTSKSKPKKACAYS